MNSEDYLNGYKQGDKNGFDHGYDEGYEAARDVLRSDCAVLEEQLDELTQYRDAFLSLAEVIGLDSVQISFILASGDPLGTIRRELTKVLTYSKTPSIV